MGKRCVKCGSTKFKETQVLKREFIHSTTTGRRSGGDLRYTGSGTKIECAGCGVEYDSYQMLPETPKCRHELFEVEFLVDARLGITANFLQPFTQTSTIDLSLDSGEKWTLIETYGEPDQTLVFKITCKECDSVIYDSIEDLAVPDLWFDMDTLKERLIEELWKLSGMKAPFRMLHDHEEEKKK